MIPGRSNLYDVTKTLVDVAIGRKKADLVIKNGDLVNVHTGEIVEGIDVAIKGDRIAIVGKADHAISSETKVIDASGYYLSPGFLDGHVHIESSMVTVTQFARSVLPRGTTAVFIDPHEIANVLGLKGIKLMLDEAKGLPLKVFVCIPSCVPSVPDFETSGAEIGPSDIETALEWEGVIGLAEMMDYPGVIKGDEEVHEKIKVTLKVGKVVEGHFAAPPGKDLIAYVASGISSCHESTTRESGLEKARLGMHVMIREGSAWRDLAEVIKILTIDKVDSRHISLVTDDRHPADLLKEGHMDFVVRRAIEEGVDPVKAIQMATLNTAEHYRVSQDIGSVSPSKLADILILEDLEKVRIKTVIVDGKILAHEGRLLLSFPAFSYPDFTRKTVRLKHELAPSDFIIKAPIREGIMKARVIEVFDGKVETKHLIEEVEVRDGKISADPENDIAKVAVIERHKLTGNTGLGLVKGFGIKKGATASTVAHDSHNLLLIGVNDFDMAKAANRLAEIGGGMIVVSNGQVLSEISLPIAGLMSDQAIESVSEKVDELSKAWFEIGCKLKSPFMTMTLLSLPVLPELRITDKGLIDTVEFKKVELLL